MADAVQLIPGAPISIIADTGATPKICKRVVISSLTRVGATATVTAYAHGLTNATAYTIEGFDVAAYNGSKTITVVDVNTFTFAGLAGTEQTPAVFNNAQVLDPSESFTAKGVRGVQVDVPPAGTTLKIEKKMHPSAGTWSQEGADITSATTPVPFIQFTTVVPLLRVRRSGGAGDFKAFVQQGYGA